MNINIPRQYLYLSVISLILFIFVLIFSFSVLIPNGKEYRIKRLDVKKHYKELRSYRNFHDETYGVLKKLQGKNVRIITAFDTTFNPQKFERQNKVYFSDLSVKEITFEGIQEEFAVYEVNTSSHINSPKSFYDFLDSVNKSNWIIAINFPIHFKRDKDIIESSFTMKVYCNNKERVSQDSVSVDK